MTNRISKRGVPGSEQAPTFDGHRFAARIRFRVCPPPSSPISGSCNRRCGLGSGFTLVELLVAVALIAILAGLALSTLGYVNRKGAESRARAEVAALSAAIESFKVDQGFYPPDQIALYTNLCPTQGNVYFEPTPRMLATNLVRTNDAGQTVTEPQFVDPWGDPYRYTNYNSYFELLSTAGNSNNTTNWIRN